MTVRTIVARAQLVADAIDLASGQGIILVDVLQMAKALHRRLSSLVEINNDMTLLSHFLRLRNFRRGKEMVGNLFKRCEN